MNRAKARFNRVWA